MSKPEPAPSVPETSGGLGCIVHLLWALLGQGLMILCTIFIFDRGAAGFTIGVPDFVFWVAVAGCLLVRYLDITRFRGRTMTGEPATIAHWRSYALRLVIVAFVLWAGAHALPRLGK